VVILRGLIPECDAVQIFGQANGGHLPLPDQPSTIAALHGSAGTGKKVQHEITDCP